MGLEAPSTTFERERLELEALLASGIFSKASGVAQLLIYVCNKYFEGAAEEIKEYNIGVAALGRPPEFDQKKDSIVRVEAHRLRKRLREYYETEGASHEIHIVLPPGQYVPEFVVQKPGPPVVESGEAFNGAPLPAETAVAPSLTAAPKAWPWRFWATAAIVLALLLAAVELYRARPASPSKLGVLAASDLSLPPASAITRIRAGYTAAEDYVDRTGKQWLSDRFFQGGWVFDSRQQQIAGTRDPSLYQTRREGLFRYDIPLPAGSYEMRLHFAETVYGENNVAGGGESSRVFSIYANGNRIVQELDVISEVGSNNADIRAFKDISPAADGKLHLTFEQHSNAPILSGIEIWPSPPGKIRPIRLLAQDRTYVDKAGNSWEPDEDVKGGQVVARNVPVRNADDPELFRGERFGNIQYSIPVPQGKYGIVLHFAEAWFGPANPGKGGAGSRLFDILCNGVALKRGLDIFQEAGGANRAMTWSAHNLEPNPQGKLVIMLVPVRNYASINALEVIDESR